MYTSSQNNNGNRYFSPPSHQSNHQPQPESPTYIESRILYRTNNAQPYHLPLFLSSSRKASQQSEIKTQSKESPRKSQSRRKKIFDYKQTVSQYRSSSPQKTVKNSFIQEYNPIQTKLSPRSGSRQKLKKSQKPKIREQLKIQNQIRKNQINKNNQTPKTKIIFKYSSPPSQTPQTYKSSISYKLNKPIAMMPTQSRDRLQNLKYENKNHIFRSPSYKNYHQLMKQPLVELNVYNYKKPLKSALFDHELQKKPIDNHYQIQPISQTSEGYLTPNQQYFQESKQEENLREKVKKVIEYMGKDDNLISVIVIALGVILVLFQILK